MKTYRRLLLYAAPYWKRCVLLLVVITLFATLNGFSLTLIPPFLKILLHDGPIEPASIESQMGIESEGIPLPAAAEKLKASVRHGFESFMYRGTATERLQRFCFVMILIMFVKNVMAYIQTYMTEYLEQKILYRIRTGIFSHLQLLPLGFFDRVRAGHIISKLTNDVHLLHGVVIGVGASVIRNALLTTIAIFIILSVSWKLTLLTFIVIPINVFLVGLIGSRLRRRSHRAQEGMADMTSSLEESIAGVRVVKAFNMGSYENRRFEGFSQRYMMQNIKMKMWGALSSPTSEFLGIISFGVILWYGGNLVLRGVIGPEMLVMFVAAMLFVVSPMKELSKLNNVVQQSLASAQRVFAILDEPVEPAGTSDVTASFKHQIVFDNVSFEYVAHQPVLRDVSFRVTPGQVVAVVGPSGAGKTTLVDMIPRFYLPTTGTISFDGVDSRTIGLESLRSLMGVVTQDTILFNDTVKNNIAYGIANPDDDTVERTARMANAHEFIMAMPHGYDTMIGDRGMQLSGGQRQRLAIARALLRDPEILIFDEATSALDTESELLVQDAIDRLLKGRTTFVIAHRLSTIQHADKILVLEGGLLRERGTHDELMDREGIYKRLYDLQFGFAE